MESGKSCMELYQPLLLLLYHYILVRTLEFNQQRTVKQKKMFDFYPSVIVFHVFILSVSQSFIYPDKITGGCIANFWRNVVFRFYYVNNMYKLIKHYTHNHIHNVIQNHQAANKNLASISSCSRQ